MPLFEIITTFLFSSINILFFIILLGIAFFLIYIAAYITIPIILFLGLLYIIRRIFIVSNIRIKPQIFIKRHENNKKETKENIIDVDYTEIK